VKSSRIQVEAVTQERAAETFINPNTGLPEILHDRPPLVLRALVLPPTFPIPKSIIVVVNHTRSFIDVELVSGEGPRVREKRKAQGESVAGLLQELQTLNPGVPVISVGDYNAFQFNDGYTDPAATIKGSPTADDQMVVDQSPDVVDPNFVNLTDNHLQSERYSFIFEGTPQAIDHIFANGSANAIFQRYAVARSNADFPEAAPFTDVTRPEAHSDHDSPIAYFSFPIPTAAGVSISGRVVTQTGRGIAGVRLVLRDGEGISMNVTTNSFGFYQFENVPSGRTYILTPLHRSFRFTPQVLNVEDNMRGVNFSAGP
jgi:hypothetical protein